MPAGDSVRREIEVLRRSGKGGASSLTPIHPDRFKDVLSSVASPVSVVTGMDEGRPHGTTVSAFCELSLDPPLVLVSLDRKSDLLAIVQRSGRFAINLLARGQHDLALCFARKGTDKFEGVDWEEQHGLPRLGGAQGWLACDVHAEVDGGDHVIVMGVVLDGEVGGGEPLLYRQRRFGTIQHHDPVTDAEILCVDVWPLELSD